MKNIVLIGMSGVGKSTIGKALAEELKLAFLDTDTYIEKIENKKINNIFKENGENYFRTLEAKIIEEISKNTNLVISTGGGVILNKKNMDFLKKNGTIVFLEASIEYIADNITKSNEERPLLNKQNTLLKDIENLYSKRKDLYIEYGEYNVFVENKKIQQIVYEILTNCVKINSWGKY